jgi:hypothetical protein
VDSGGIAANPLLKEGVCLLGFYSNHYRGKKLRNIIGFPLHARKLSAGILNSQQTILSRPKHALGSDKLAREASEAVSESAIIMHNRAADDTYK